MKSLRLTKQLRESILNSFIEKYKTANPEPALTIDEYEIKCDLAEAIHEKVYSSFVGKIPEDMYSMSRCIKIMWPNESIASLYFRDNASGEDRRISTRVSKVEYVLTKDDTLYIDYQCKLELYRKEQSIYNEYQKNLSKFKSNISQVLESVNTTKQLVEVWPESEPFLPKEVSNPSSINLPAVNFAEINKVIQ